MQALGQRPHPGSELARTIADEHNGGLRRIINQPIGRLDHDGASAMV